MRLSGSKEQLNGEEPRTYGDKLRDLSNLANSLSMFFYWSFVNFLFYSNSFNSSLFFNRLLYEPAGCGLVPEKRISQLSPLGSNKRRTVQREHSRSSGPSLFRSVKLFFFLI